MATPGRLAPATAVVALLLGFGALCWLASAGPASVIAGRPLPLFGSGLLLPAGMALWGAPALVAAGHWGLIRPLPASGLRRGLAGLSLALLLGFWLLALARHDRALSAFHAGLVLGPALAGAVGWQLLARALSVGGLLAALSWGAIWGEERCAETGPVGCLADTGLRVRVPQALAAAGLPAFARLAGADLRGADLSGRDLRYADLRGADLRGTDFSGSNLRRALIAGADARAALFTGSDLTGADLRGADLGDADLRRLRAYAADLRDTRLSAARIDGASLSHAALAGACFEGARLTGTYLRFVSGLAPAQLVEACGDAQTLLPPGFTLRACAAQPGS